MQKLSVVFYKTFSGSEPVREFLLELNKEDKRVIGGDIRVVEWGWPIGMPVCKPLSSGLYEVRSTISSKREARVMFCIENGDMILLHSFIKKSQKTKTKDIDLARKRQKDVQS